MLLFDNLESDHGKGSHADHFAIEHRARLVALIQVNCEEGYLMSAARGDSPRRLSLKRHAIDVILPTLPNFYLDLDDQIVVVDAEDALIAALKVKMKRLARLPGIPQPSLHLR